MIDLDKINTENYTVSELAEIWNTLNVWEWCDLLGDAPSYFYNLPNYKRNAESGVLTKAHIIEPACKKIEAMIGIKECLRWLNIIKLGKTEEEFDEFWGKNT